MINRLYLNVLLVPVIILLATSCSKNIYQSNSNATILYPPPPDTARIQFLTRFGNSTDFIGKQSKFKTFITGKDEPLPIKKPYGITLHKGIMYIVDPEIAGLHIIDLEKNTFKYFLPVGRGKLRLPINCDFDKEGNLYVSDVDRQQVVVFDEKMEYKGEIGGNKNFHPTDVAIVGDTVFISDPKNNQINVYDRSSRRLLSSFPERAEVGDEAWLYNPLNLCVTRSHIYVTDFGSSRIKIFNMKGKYQRSVGSYGRGLGQFVRPKGIAVDREDILYVIDAGFQNVQLFNKEGQLLMFLGGPYNGPGDMYLPANVTIDYNHLQYFEQYVDPEYKLQYLIFVTNQYGPDKVNVYGRLESK